MSHLNAHRAPSRSTARHRPGGRAILPIAALAALITGACVAENVRPTTAPSPTPTAGPSVAVTASASLAPASPAATPANPGAAPTPIPDPAPIEVRLDTVTVICESWGSELPPSTIDCGGAVKLGLAALGVERAASVQRLDFRFGTPCDGSPCEARRPDVGWVLARSAALDTLLVRVAIDADGALRAWPAVEGPTQPTVPFHAPAKLAPDLDGAPPAELRDREALPFCGRELMANANAFDRSARTCFLNAVLAGTPVELISRTPATDGGFVTSVYRFLGHGAVLRYINADGRWTVARCGIEPIATRAVFLMAGTCDRREL